MTEYSVYKVVANTKDPHIFRSFVVKNDDYALTYVTGMWTKSNTPIFIFPDFNANTALSFRSASDDMTVLRGISSTAPKRLTVPFGLDIYESNITKLLVQTFWHDVAHLSVEELGVRYIQHLSNFITQSYVVYDFKPLEEM